MKRVIVIDGIRSTIGSAIAKAAEARGDSVVDYHLMLPCAPKDDHTLVCCRGTFTGSATNLIEVNLTDAIRKTDTALQEGFTRVILFAGAGVGGVPGRDTPPAYQAAKAGLCVFVERMAMEYPNAALHIISPGRVASRLTDWDGESPDRTVLLVMWLTEEPRRYLSGRMIAVRFETPEVLAKLEPDVEHGAPYIADDIMRLRRVLP